VLQFFDLFFQNWWFREFDDNVINRWSFVFLQSSHIIWSQYSRSYW